MDDLIVVDITGQQGTFTVVCDRTTAKAWFRDENGNVRYQAVKDGKCKESVSAVQRKTDKRRKPDIQTRIDAIWAMLHKPGVRWLGGQTA